MLLITSGSIIISLSMSFIMASSPLSTGLWVLLIALSTSWLTGVMFNSWFAIMIFLIYIGGMLVMFAYFTALTPNQPLEMSLLWSSFLFAMMIILPLFFTSYSSTPMMMSQTSPLMNLSITTLFSATNSFILLFLASILFFILVAVVKITLLTMGPLRPFK